MRVVLASLLCVMMFDAASFAAREVRQEEVRFKGGESSTTITDTIKGDQSVDYRLQAKAGQTLAVSFKPGNLSAYFNLLPPGSNDVAMFVGSTSGNYVERVLPGDGVYVVRVYLMRSAARRNESSNFTLNLKVTGKALEALPSSMDATLPGTPFHASTRVSCVPLLASGQQDCEAFVVRRSFDGTATVEIHPAGAPTRRILFIREEPKASDSQDEMIFTRQADLITVKFANEEWYEIPKALISGG